jgi:hypothetical protein
MNATAHLDPFQLLALSEDIDRQCQRLVARDLPKVVDEKALLALKVAVRDHLFSLFTEMLNEWRHLAEQAGDASIFDEQWVIPSVPEMTRQLPQIYISPPDDPDARKAWRVERVRWVISSWLQMWGQLFAYLPKAEDEKTAAATPPPEPSLTPLTRPFHLHAVLRIWQMLRLLTLEYLAKKADLLTELGLNDISIDVADETPDILSQATEAFWQKRPDASLLLVLAMRDALLNRLNARERLRAIHVHLSTSSLLSIAANAGLSFAHPVEVLGSIITDLEEQQNLGERLDISYLYPVFRILTDTVQQLQSAGDDAEVHLRASGILDQLARQSASHGNRSQG